MLAGIFQHLLVVFPNYVAICIVGQYAHADIFSTSIFTPPLFLHPTSQPFVVLSVVTIALPNPLSRSTLLGTPLATLPTSGSMCQSHCCAHRDDSRAFSASCPPAVPPCVRSLTVSATSSPLHTGTSCRACVCDSCSPPDRSPCTPRLVVSATSGLGLLSSLQISSWDSSC